MSRGRDAPTISMPGTAPSPPRGRGRAQPTCSREAAESSVFSALRRIHTTLDARFRVSDGLIAPRRLLATTLLLAALACAAQAGAIHAKAWLAQVLLERAWRAHLADDGAHRPWPWADTAPVARLSMPRLGVSQIVLAGDSGRTLAFGPGWAQASAMPNTAGTAVISGHRDTHFAWLRDVTAGDELRIETRAGERRYRIVATAIADSRDERIALDGDDALVLVTCWPFDAVSAGGPLRYVVRAMPVGGEPRPATPHSGSAQKSQRSLLQERRADSQPLAIAASDAPAPTRAPRPPRRACGRSRRRSRAR